MSIFFFFFLYTYERRLFFFFFFSSRRRHTRSLRDWSSDVCSSDLDLENGFADAPAGVAETMRMSIEVGLAGASVEDFTGRADDPIYDIGLAAERIAAAAEAAHGGPGRLVLTARAENYLHGRPDLADTIARLQAFQEAGA